MKRIVLIAVLIGVVGFAAVFGLVRVVSAQGNPTATPAVPGQGYGRGGMMGQGQGMMGGEQGAMHEDMEAALAEKLGLTVEALEDLNDQGKTFWQIAEDKGFTAEEAQQMMLDARTSAIDKAVKDGTLTQAQADWMKQRSGQMMGNGGQGGCMGDGTGTTRGGRMGGRRW
jgi:hypothetical protein